MSESSDIDLEKEIERIRAEKIRKLLQGNSENEEYSSPVHLTAKNFVEFISEGTAVVDFWAPWCGPCRYIAPMIEKLAKELKGKVKFGKLNVDEEPNIAATFGINAIPTLYIFKDGKPVYRHVGLVPYDELKRIILSRV